MKILSLGMGVQSTALYYMSSMGLLPRLDYAIFSDPGKEKKGTYKYIDFLLKWKDENNGIPIIIRKDKNLYNDLISGTNSSQKRFASIPAFTDNLNGSVSILRRQCTGEYKIHVVYKAIRELYGLAPRKRVPETEIWQGITLDEIQRATIPFNRSLIYVYPFIGYKTTIKNKAQKVENDYKMLMDRNNVIRWYHRVGLPVPPRSACTFCPFQTNHEWENLKQDQEDFESAILVDQAIRNSSKRGITQPIYLHRSLKPITEINFKKESLSLDLDENECSGFCRI